MKLVRVFFSPKSGHFSLDFEKGQGRPPPPPPSSYAPVIVIIRELPTHGKETEDPSL